MVTAFWVIFINLTCSFSALLSSANHGLARHSAQREGGVHMTRLYLIPSTGFKENFVRFSADFSTAEDNGDHGRKKGSSADCADLKAWPSLRVRCSRRFNKESRNAGNEERNFRDRR